jgi:predicted  nucleic acid-binding Zn-ribbon protein
MITAYNMPDDFVKLASDFAQRYKDLMAAQREIAQLQNRVINLQKENQALSYRLAEKETPND